VSGKKREQFQIPQMPIDPAQKIITLLQFARKAGKLAHGYEACSRQIRNDSIRLLILATDCSANTKDKMKNLIKRTGDRIPVKEFKTQQELSAALGLPLIAVLGVLDSNFAGKILSYFTQ